MTQTQNVVRQLYKDDTGNPILRTPGQDEIFEAIVTRHLSARIPATKNT